MTDAEIRLLCESIGEQVRDFYRTYYLWQDQLDTRTGDLTLDFECGRTLRLTDTPHGYDLTVAAQRWVDPFGKPLDAVTQQWVHECGKWIEVCLNSASDWRPFLGKRLTAVGRLIYVSHREPCGVALHFQDDLAMFVYNLADEVIVQQFVAPPGLVEQPLCFPEEPAFSNPQARP
jgi:hypothetical protein